MQTPVLPPFSRLADCQNTSFMPRAVSMPWAVRNVLVSLHSNI